MAIVRRRLVNPPRRKRNAFTFGKKRTAARGAKRSAAGSIFHSLSLRKSKNPVVTAVGNPRRRKKTMAKKHHKAKTHTTKRRRRRNPIAAAAVPVAVNPRRRRRNPNVGGLVKGTVGMLPQAGILIGGAVGARMLTQAVLGSKNAGILGYGVHVLSTAGMAAIAGKFLGAQGAFMAGLGGTTSLLLRLIGDFTPLGSRLALAGIGDYQVSTIFSPKRYIDPLRSAAVELPLALQPPAAPAAATPRPAVSGVGRRTLYSRRSMYS